MGFLAQRHYDIAGFRVFIHSWRLNQMEAQLFPTPLPGRDRLATAPGRSGTPPSNGPNDLYAPLFDNVLRSCTYD